jgi:hypothetical protein
MPEAPLDHVREPLDVPMRVHGPDRTGDQPVVVEHTHRPELHVLGVVIGVERVVPPGAEPSAVHVGDLVVAPDLDHGWVSAAAPAIRLRVTAQAYSG